jgi:hypothetical protein
MNIYFCVVMNLHIVIMGQISFMKIAVKRGSGIRKSYNQTRQLVAQCNQTRQLVAQCKMRQLVAQCKMRQLVAQCKVAYRITEVENLTTVHVWDKLI